MSTTTRIILLSAAISLASALAWSAPAADRVKTSNGIVEGLGEQSSGVRIFKGIPFARPPVGDLRWQPPRGPANWQGVRQAIQFGPRCMQQPIFGDMNFRSNGMSEDCLYLNVWTPAKQGNERLPVLIYFYGGGFIAGDGSEPRYDGESIAAKGIVVVTMNYRLGVFGFLAHPGLTRESSQHASGNYGLLDQNAALRWVRQNIAAFGGNPRNVTIAGESAGSASVSAQMASPLSKDLIAGAIGESGSILATIIAVPLSAAEQAGSAFATAIGAKSLASLRAMSAAQLLEAAGKPGVGRFSLTVDGYFLPERPVSIYASGKQAHVPLLVGWNSEEMTWKALLDKDEPTPENYEKVVRKLYGDRAPEVLKLYPAATSAEVIDSATDLASDRFLGYSTWKWFDLHTRTGGKPVYRYFYSRPRPQVVPELGNATPGLAGGIIKSTEARPAPAPPAKGAVHSAEIEYAMGNLATNKVFSWTPEDYQVSKVMQEYFANFVKTGDPNGPGLPSWPVVSPGKPVQIMRLDVQSGAESDKRAGRYLFLDQP
jgi:para-nitrobenzyl esterase